MIRLRSWKARQPNIWIGETDDTRFVYAIYKNFRLSVRISNLGATSWEKAKRGKEIFHWQNTEKADVTKDMIKNLLFGLICLPDASLNHFGS